jgi:alpha-ketoglutarate-dependent taurine dioxygenase
MAGLQVCALRPEFGAKITGLQPDAPLPADVRRELRALFDDRGLLVFPELGADTRFQTYLSQVLAGDAMADPDALELFDNFKVSNLDEKAAAPFGRLLWHNDLTWVPDGCRLVSLYGVEVEQPSVPTSFISTIHAWETLSPDLRAQVVGCNARTPPRSGERTRKT